MLKIWTQGQEVFVRIGVACNEDPLKTLSTPLTFRFNPAAVDFARLERKILFLQEQMREMPPGKRHRLVEEALRLEAFRASKIQHVFSNKQEPIVEPNDEEQRIIMATPDEEFKIYQHRLMKNTATARVNAMERSYMRRADGRPVIIGDDPRLIQGDIYQDINAMRGFSGPLEGDFVGTGVWKKNKNGDKGFLTANPLVTAEFMHDYGSFLNSDFAHNIHPIIVSLLARTMVVLVHPVDDGNGRTAGITQEQCMKFYGGGIYDLCDVVTVTHDADRPVLVLDRQQSYVNLNRNADSSGEVRMDSYFNGAGNVLEDMVDEAMIRAQIKMPILGRL